MVAFLQRQGFAVLRTRGSHHVMRRGDLWTTVPVHSGKNLKLGTLRRILRDIQMSPTEFAELWTT
jgi:predicted RNA binding protein YcfA (HicA-like mRNA interferase family)